MKKETKRGLLKVAKKLSVYGGSAMGLLLFLVGTYNTVSLNSVSYMQDNEIQFVKRLDEVTGKIVAASSEFNMNMLNRFASRPVPTAAPKRIVRVAKPTPKKVVAKKEPQVAPERFAAVITQDLELDLTEVFNSKLFKGGLTPNDFSGKLFAANGVIESLEVTLPNNQSIEVGYAEMAGNVFKYEIDGLAYSGMMYEVKAGEYMVTLANGPYQGTRMKFKGYVEEVYPEVTDRNVAADNYQEEYVDEYEKNYANESNSFGNPGDNYYEEAKAAPVKTSNGQAGFGYKFGETQPYDNVQ